MTGGAPAPSAPERAPRSWPVQHPREGPGRGRRGRGAGARRGGEGRAERAREGVGAAPPFAQPGSPGAEAAGPGRSARREGGPGPGRSLPRRAAGTGGAGGSRGARVRRRGEAAGPAAPGSSRDAPPPRAPPRPAARPRPGSWSGISGLCARPPPPSSGPWYAPGDRCLGIFNIWDAANAEVK